ncbi:crossover junction endonuclease EME1 isoform X2 [Zalophus californianus]|uniref:Crossover junction endonuclease EME1 isoform X2 n=1 Tax=Zalophus californianus TaxID=9704 RepID=A0A6J2FMY8_ZALCA|nr:crossover junction endonuclease EME1 isoform X2 [Zalophus californianus]
MALKKSSLALDSSESDSEELPTFAFLKKEPSSTKRRQPQREAKIVVVDTSDSEASCPPSPRLKDVPPIPDTAEPVTQTEPVRVLSSESEDEEELAPLAERLTCKFLTCKQLSPEDSGSPVKSVWDHQNSEGASRDWENQPFPKVPDLPLHETSERHASTNKDLAGDNPRQQLLAFKATCPVPNGSWTITKTNAEIPPFQKRTKHSQKVQRRGLQGCQPWRQQERTKKAAPVNRLKAQRPEECLKHVVVGLDPVLLQTEGGGQLLGALQSMECRCVIEAQAVPCSITWRRRAAPAEDGQEDWVEEPMVLALLPAEAFVSMVQNFKEGNVGGTEKGKETLRSFVTDATARAAGKALSLVIVDQEQCFSYSAPNPPRRRKQGVADREQAKEKKQRRPEANTGCMVSRVDVEEALVDMQLYTQAQARMVQSWKELADFACAFTKAVAEAPFKEQRPEDCLV